MSMKTILLWVLAALVFRNADTCAEETQHLIPWPSLNGAPHPDEAALDTAAWTTRARESLPPRLVRNLTQDWTFNYFPAETLDPAVVASNTEDARWPLVALPHTWHTFETTREIHPFIARPSERDSAYWWNGWGVYRKSFALNAETVKGRRVFAEFDGVMKYCRVWLNGKEIGDHKGGYGSFYFDLTPHLNAGNNLLAVAVSARRDDVFRTPPMAAGNFDTYGGIYRDVRLVVKSAVHIPFQGSATQQGGTFVTTPIVSAERATVRVRTWVKNDDTQPRSVLLRTKIVDPEGKQITQDETRAELAAGALQEFDQTKFEVQTPQLWSPETPILYRVESEVNVDNNIVDRSASPLGFRWFEWKMPENRGYLNGKIVHFHGTNRHQEFPWLGDAVPSWIHVRDMADIRFGQGHNFIRTAHYTQDSLVYDLADRYGILICEEVPNIKAIEFDKGVQHQQVLEMVRRDRNHPSIIFWSMGNETSHPADSAWAHQEDDTRIIHVRHNSNPKEAGKFITHTEANMDMENLLRCTVRGWSDSDVAKFEPKNGQQSGHEEWQHAQAMVEGSGTRGRIDMPNGVMWIYADHGADRNYQNTPLLGINPKGWTDIYRIPKYMYYLWQANYTPEPMLFVHPHAWQPRYLGQKKDIVVDSNCRSVELFVNGRSAGIQAPSAENFWNVTFKDVLVERGELRAVAKTGEQSITCRVVMANDAARLTLTSSHSMLEAKRSSVAIITVDAVDERGVPVQGFSKELRWEISGPATFVSPDKYKSDIRQNGAANGTFYIVAPACALLRSTGDPGDIVVTVSADGVAAGTLKLASIGVEPRPSFVVEPAVSSANRQPVATAPPDAGGARVAAFGRAAKRAAKQGDAQPKAAVGFAMKPATQDLEYPPGKERAFYKEELKAWFAKHDPDSAKRTLPFDALLNVLAQQLAAGGGKLVADDFNQRALQFNDACALESAVLARHLPAAYATLLRRNYAKRLITDGVNLRIEEESKWIAALPSDSKAEVIDKTRNARELFKEWYPESEKFTAEKRDAAFARFQKINAAAGTPLFDEHAKDPQVIKYLAKAPLLRPSLEQLEPGAAK